MEIYFIGICGTAMANVAIMLKEQGYKITGSDLNVYPPMSNMLQKAGIEIFEGYSYKRLEKINPDLVVVGNAISRGNEEVEYLLETNKFEYTSLASLISSLVLKGRKNVLISGTHGKTTTSCISAYLLSSINAGYLIGGVAKSLEKSSSMGDKNAPFVIEADEYDTAFFDKRSKFIHYRPTIVGINNLEFDHADIFRDLTDVKRTFTHLLRIVPRNGYIVLNGDDKNVMSLPKAPWTNTITVGTDKSCTFTIADFKDFQEGSSFTLLYKNKAFANINWGLNGLYNARNCLMAVVCSMLAKENSFENLNTFDYTILSKFEGVKRRQEQIAKNKNCLVIEDFGHHPSAISQTISSLKQRFSNKKIIACFEPRSATARMSVFQDDFAKALKEANNVLIAPVFNRNESNFLDTEVLAKAINQTNAKAYLSNEDLLEDLKKLSKNDDCVVVFFSNGAFGAIIEKFSKFINS